MSDIQKLINGIGEQIQRKSEARDRALVDSRQVVRHAANAIRALHRAEFELAESHLAQGGEMVRATKADLVGFPDLYWAGYVQDAQKEFAEANAVAAMIRGGELPPPRSLDVEEAPYLNGLAEAASEMRRYVLDIIRTRHQTDMAEAERVLDLMDEIYSSLITVDFPDSITGGLRRTCDALRGVLERTRGDMTLSIRQAELTRALSKFHRVEAD